MLKRQCENIQAIWYNALAWINKRAENGDEKAKLYLYSSNKGVMKKIVEYMTELAEKGDVDAQYNLGLHYKQTPSENDDEKAVKWFTKAAENDCIAASWNLGMYYEYGIGNIEKNIDEAKKWYKKVAESSDIAAISAAEKLKELS